MQCCYFETLLQVLLGILKASVVFKIALFTMLLLFYVYGDIKKLVASNCMYYL